jgi:hypothetical protein
MGMVFGAVADAGIVAVVSINWVGREATSTRRRPAMSIDPALTHPLPAAFPHLDWYPQVVRLSHAVGNMEVRSCDAMYRSLPSPFAWLLP